MKNLLLRVLLGALIGFSSFASAVEFNKKSYIEYKIPQNIRTQAGLPDDFPDNVKIDFAMNSKDDCENDSDIDFYTIFATKISGYWFMLSIDQKNENLTYYHLTIARLSDNETVYGRDGDTKLPISDIAGYISRQ
jgi:hypothetical protein